MRAASFAALGAQVLILIACVNAVWGWASSFPYPAPLLKPLLPPQKRWPAAQVARWVESGRVDSAFLEFFYRDPERDVPAGDNVVAPAAGIIREIARENGKTYVNIALTVWDVHVQRNPADGEIVGVKRVGDTYMDGEGRNLAFLRDKLAPVQKIISYKTKWGEMKVRLITSLLARRIEVWR